MIWVSLGFLVQWKNAYFVIFFTSGPWFKPHRTQGFFARKIFNFPKMRGFKFWKYVDGICCVFENGMKKAVVTLSPSKEET